MGNRDRFFEDFFRLIARKTGRETEGVFRPVDGQASAFTGTAVYGVAAARGYKLHLCRDRGCVICNRLRINRPSDLQPIARPDCLLYSA